MRRCSLTGTVDAQGHTITRKGGSAALGTTFEDATIVVAGDLNANGAIVDMLQSNETLENITIVQMG